MQVLKRALYYMYCMVKPGLPRMGAKGINAATFLAERV